MQYTPDVLIIAEKKSVAKDIADVIGLVSVEPNHFVVKGGAKVAYAQGHLVEIAAPAVLNPSWGERWNWGQLPMIPDKWMFVPVERTKKLLTGLQVLLKSAKTVIIATDAGREGELIARQILQYAKWKGEVKRFWTSALMPEDIRNALDNLMPGSAKDPLYEAAVARSRLDNVFGYTGSRSTSLAARVFKESFPMGRVQTPVLGMVVVRTLQNKGFDSSFYYTLDATVKTSGGHTLTMKHQLPKGEKITNKTEAERLKSRLLAASNGQSAPLKKSVSLKVAKAPLAFSLPKLQQVANRVYSFSSKRTLEIAQELYDSKFITYPRTDSEHLATSQIPTMEPTLDAVAAIFPAEVKRLRAMGVLFRPSTFDNTKLGDHHGLVPTTKSPHTLSGEQLQLYKLIAAQALMLLAPDYEYESIKISMKIDGEDFAAKGKKDKVTGWTEFRGLR